MASKSKRNKTKFKITKELIFLISFLAAIIIATIILSVPSANARSLDRINTAITQYNSENSTSYSTLPKKNCFKELSNSSNYDTVVDKLVDAKSSSEYTYFVYGLLTNATFLEQLSVINQKAETYEVENVYIFYASYVKEAEDEATTDTLSYKNKISEYEGKINSDVDKDIKSFELAKYPAILVFKDGKLVFNSQVGNDSSEYSWSIYVNQALSIAKRS